MKVRIKASDYFNTGMDQLNCAQAVLYKWKNQFQIEPEIIDYFRYRGGGNALHGECGALHAAKYLFEGKEKIQNAIHERFVEQVGSPACNSILSAGTCSCAKCVDTADQIIHELCTPEKKPGK